MYHFIRDLKHSRYPEIKGLDLALFKHQLQYISKYYKVVQMEDVIEALKSYKRLPKNSLLLTFDDGLKEHFEVVFPILDRLGFQGSFFPPGKAIYEHKVLDVHKISFVLASVKDKNQLIDDIHSLMDKYRTEYKLKPNEHYYEKVASRRGFDHEQVVLIKSLLQKNLPKKLRETIINNLFSKYVGIDEAVFSRELYMDVEQLKCLIRQGMYLGNHGWNHYRLNGVPAAQQAEEIDLSLNFLEILGCNNAQWVMSYPYGEYDSSLTNLLKRRGCALALTTQVGIANLATCAPYGFPRLDTNDLPKNKDAAPNEWTLKVIEGQNEQMNSNLQ